MGKNRGRGREGGLATHSVLHLARPVNTLTRFLPYMGLETDVWLARLAMADADVCEEGARGTGTSGAIRWASRAVNLLVTQRGRAPVALSTGPLAYVK